MYTGKNFEEDFSKSFQESHKNRLLRLYDTTNGFAGIANPCDFVYYVRPFIGFFELKSVAGTRLPFSNITDRQWQGLTDRSKLSGVVAAVLIQFREANQGYLVPINVLNHLKLKGAKSISIGEARDFGMPLKLIYKRVRCYLDPEVFMEDFVEYAYNNMPNFPEEFECQD